MHAQKNQWPVIYADLKFDPKNPWSGLLRNELLVMVCVPKHDANIYRTLLQAYKHVFTSPSSVDFDEPKSTRSGNARIHRMTSVTAASVAYIATQVIKYL